MYGETLFLGIHGTEELLSIRGRDLKYGKLKPN